MGWLAEPPIRHFTAASTWVVGALLLFMYLVFTFITAADPGDPSAFPVILLVASEHAVYTGVITNIVLGPLSILVLRGARPAYAHAIVWGVNAGLLVFVVGLIVDTSEIERIGAPLMGITLLFALAVLAWRAWSATLDASRIEDWRRGLQPSGRPDAGLTAGVDGMLGPAWDRSISGSCANARRRLACGPCSSSRSTPA